MISPHSTQNLATLLIHIYNEFTMKSLQARVGHLDLLKIFFSAAAVIILGSWLIFAPPGLLGKADAVAYAVCHRIAERSYYIGDRQMPLCARCTGMYLGALVGMLYMFRYGKRGGMPPRKLLFVLGLFVVAFGVDGVNSYLHFFPAAPHVYQPQNWLRLLTGTGMGLVIAALLTPIFNQSLWRDWDSRPALGSWRQMAVLIGISLMVDLAVVSENPLLEYPLALLSAATVVIILTMIYTIVWIMIFKKENSFTRISGVWSLLVAGFAVGMLQVYVIDWLRMLITHTWNGFNIG